MADLMARYAADIRLSHSSLSLATLQGLVDEATRDLGLKSANTLAALDTDLALAVSRLSASLSTVLDSDQVVQSASSLPVSTSFSDPRPRTATHIPPWTERVAEMAASTASTIDAEHRALKLAEELRDARREMRVREAAMQESSVKIELMDRRMEAVKKQVRALAGSTVQW
jgi:dynactin 1